MVQPPGGFFPPSGAAHIGGTHVPPPPPPPPPARVFTDMNLLQEAATQLATVLQSAGVRYAFCGGFAVHCLGDTRRETNDIDVVVSGGLRPALEAIRQSQGFRVLTGAGEAVRVQYRASNRAIIALDLLVAGEFGPRALFTQNEALDGSGGTVARVGNYMLLSPTELLRMKVRAWVVRALNQDAVDIHAILSLHPRHINLNRANYHNGLEELAKLDVTVFIALENAKRLQGLI